MTETRHRRPPPCPHRDPRAGRERRNTLGRDRQRSGRRAAELLRYAALHAATPTRQDIARIANLLATDTTQPGGALGYLAVVEICRQ